LPLCGLSFQKERIVVEIIILLEVYLKKGFLQILEKLFFQEIQVNIK